MRLFSTSAKLPTAECTRALLTDHPYFVGFQAHPEFCTRPLNPSPPFLGFVAAAAGQSVLEEQIAHQLKHFRPPHPEGAMVSEDELRRNDSPPPGAEKVMREEA